MSDGRLCVCVCELRPAVGPTLRGIFDTFSNRMKWLKSTVADDFFSLIKKYIELNRLRFKWTNFTGTTSVQINCVQQQQQH